MNMVKALLFTTIISIKLARSREQQAQPLDGTPVYRQLSDDKKDVQPLQEVDVSTLQNITTALNLPSWSGDPCKLSWVGCSQDASGTHIVDLSLYNVHVTMEKLRRAVSNTSNYGLNDLQVLSFRSSTITNEGARYIVDTWLSHTTSPTFTLDFANNALTSISFLESTTIATIAHLGYSCNTLQYPATSKDIYSRLTMLISLTSNNLEGTLDLSLLPESVRSGVYLDLSFNKVANLNLSVLPGFTGYIRLDYNKLSDVLSLKPWLDNFQDGNYSTCEDLPQISLTDNDIKTLDPSLDILQTYMDPWLRNTSESCFQRGILLGGNPICQRKPKSLTEKWFCRNNFYPIQGKKNSHTIPIVGSTIGAFCGLLLVVMLILVWRLLKRVKTLQHIQEELGAQEVKPQFYSYSNLHTATRGFHKDNKLGGGGFGTVYKGVLKDGTIIAVKKLTNLDQNNTLRDFLNEVLLITGIKHKNLNQLKGCCVTDKERILIYEYAENGDLGQAIWNWNLAGINDGLFLDWPQRFNICLGVARGLAYLHEELQPRIIHRDIKPANILLDKDLNPKIADFGLAKSFPQEASQAPPTRAAWTTGYCSPEYAMDLLLTEKADVYSFGIVLLEIISGRKCIDYTKGEEDPQRYLRSWAEELYNENKLDELVQPELKSTSEEAYIIRAIHIALVCIQWHPNSRPAMSQVVIMLLGNMDVQQFLNPSERISVMYPSYPTEQYDSQARNVQDSTESPLLSMSSSNSTRATKKSVRWSREISIELSDQRL